MINLIILALVTGLGLQFCFKLFSSRQKLEQANSYHMVRRVQHLLTGAMILICIETLSYNQAQIAAVLGTIVIGGITIARFNSPVFNDIFVKHFQHLLRPHEKHGFPGAFYFIAGVTWGLFNYSKDVSSLGILLIAVGDPSAAIIGLSFPKSQKLYYGKNVAGTVGSALVFMVCGTVYAQLTDNILLQIYDVNFTPSILFLVGLIIEMIPLGQTVTRHLRLDDNFFANVIGCYLLNKFVA